MEDQVMVSKIKLRVLLEDYVRLKKYKDNKEEEARKKAKQMEGAMIVGDIYKDEDYEVVRGEAGKAMVWTRKLKSPEKRAADKEKENEQVEKRIDDLIRSLKGGREEKYGL